MTDTKKLERYYICTYNGFTTYETLHEAITDLFGCYANDQDAVLIGNGRLLAKT